MYHVLVSTTERRTPALLDFCSDVAKTLKHLPLIDPERSTFGRSGTGAATLRRAAYRQDLADRFLVARDVDHPGRLVCGPRLVELVEATKLRVSFRPADGP